MSMATRDAWRDLQSILNARLKGFLENPGEEQLDALVAEMKAYASAAQTGKIEIPQRWVSYH
jgi:hypothetical protein